MNPFFYRNFCAGQGCGEPDRDVDLGWRIDAPAAQAVELGLVDKIGYLDDAIARATSIGPKVHRTGHRAPAPCTRVFIRKAGEGTRTLNIQLGRLPAPYGSAA